MREIKEIERLKRVKASIWSFWDIDPDKTVKAYDEDLNFIGWLYYGSWRLILLEYGN